jgi:uncharacterized protein involved in exopolysaccharide biosynthesis
MVERDNVFELQDYLAVLRRQRALVAAVAVLAAVAGALWFLVQTPEYEARAELTLERVRTAQDVSLNELLNPTGTVGNAEVQAATSREVAERAAGALGEGSATELRQQVTASAADDAPILRITAIDEDPAGAAAIADAFAQAFVEHRRDQAIETVLTAQQELETRAADLRAEISTVDAQLEELGAEPQPTGEIDPETGEEIL